MIAPEDVDNVPGNTPEVPSVKVFPPILRGPFVRESVPDAVGAHPILKFPRLVISTPEPEVLLIVKLLI
jgi:hypothetical protein